MLSKLENAPSRVLILYFHVRMLPESTVDRLARWVEGGGGMIALHSVSASCKRDPGFGTLLGAHFNGHGPITPFALRPAPEALGIFRALPGIHLRDEIYHHRFSKDIQVQIETDHEGQTLPMAWTRRHGRGRIFCFAPGHKAETWENPGVLRILAAGLDWVTGAGEPEAAATKKPA